MEISTFDTIGAWLNSTAEHGAAAATLFAGGFHIDSAVVHVSIDGDIAARRTDTQHSFLSLAAGDRTDQSEYCDC